MIEINLIPPELRKKKGGLFSDGFNIPLEIIVGCGGALIGLLVIAHIGLLAINMKKLSAFKKLEAQWSGIATAKANVDVVKADLKEMKARRKAIEEVTEKQKIVWSKKLNVISDSLPRGVWLKKISLGEEAFFIEGSAISRQKKEMINVHSFAAALKKNKDFLKHLVEVEVGSINRRRINKMEIADFLITTKLEEL